MSNPNDPVVPLHTGLETTDEAHRGELLGEATLVVINGLSVGKRFQLVANETLIGRGSDVHVRLEDRPISTRHSKIVRDSDRHLVFDLGSTNGTYLNGRRLAPNVPTELNPGDSLQIAETVLAYMPTGSSPQEHTQYLSKVLPQLPSVTSLQLSEQQQPMAAELQVLAQLLSAPPQPPEPPGLTLEEHIARLRRAWVIVRRNWVPLFAATALFALAGNISVFVRPPSSEATFKIRITPPKEEHNSDPADPNSDVFATAAEQNYLSTALIESTLASMGMKDHLRDRVNVVRANLRFETIAYNTYRGSFMHRDPKQAVDFLSHHVENYLLAEIARNLHVIQAEKDFLAARVQEREGELHRTEEALRDFKNKHLAGLPEYTASHMASIETLLARKVTIEAEASRASLQLENARKRLSEESPLLSRKVAGAAPFEAALVDVQKKLAEARGKGLGDAHPEVQALARQQADLQRQADQARQSTATDLDRSTDVNLLSLKRQVGDYEVASRAAGAELGGINGELARLDAIVKKVPEVEAKYSELTRSYTINKEMHAQLFQQLRDTQLKLELERTSAKARYEVLAAPESSGIPLRETLAKRTGIGAAVGLVLGALIAVFLELRRLLRSRRKQAANAGTSIVRVGDGAPPQSFGE